MPRAVSKKEPDLTSVRTLVTSVTKLAREVELTPAAIYRWINVNRIPGKYLTKVCNLYDVEIRDLLPLTGSDESNETTVVIKPKNTLRTLMDVYQGKMSLDDAATHLEVTKRSLHLVMFHWGDELPTLYSTLEQLDQKRITLDEACERLKVAKYTLHGIRRKYGYAPGKLVSKKPKSKINERRAAQREKALEVIAGRMTADKASEEMEVSYRSMFRYIESVSPYKLRELTHWPVTFRQALAEELKQNLPIYSKKWLDFANNARLVLKKRSKYSKIPENLGKEPIKRLLASVLLDETTIEGAAAARGADPEILVGLFTSDLKPLGVTYEQLMALPVFHQLAVADILLATLHRARRVPE